jgi:Tol biopolymer transport system component
VVLLTMVALSPAVAAPATAGAPTGGDLRAGDTARVSVASSGAEANGDSRSPTVSGDGRYVAFSSNAANLVPADTNGTSDVFVRDRQTGRTVRASVSGSGAEADGESSSQTISASGRYVAFASWATNLVPGDTNNGSDIFVRDLRAGTTTRVSVSDTGAEPNHYSSAPAITPDGRHVAFFSWATNLVPGDTNDSSDVFVRDLRAGTTTRVSVSSAGVEGDFYSSTPAISANGRYVAFESWASNLVAGDTNDSYDVFVRDRLTGTTTRVSVSSTGAQGSYHSSDPAITPDGRYVAFESTAAGLVPEEVGGFGDVFIRDLRTGTTTRVSVSGTGGPANGPSEAPTISANGRYVAFDSDASNLVPGDTNWRDVFVRDRRTGATTLVSVSSTGAEDETAAFTSMISADGRHVVFESNASNLVPGDTNGSFDVFLRGNPS